MIHIYPPNVIAVAYNPDRRNDHFPSCVDGKAVPHKVPDSAWADPSSAGAFP